jgi:predicted ester cyclase
MTADSAVAAENEAAYRRAVDAISAGREDVLVELLDEGFIDHNPVPDQAPGPPGFAQWLRAVRAALPDLSATVEDVVVGSDRVAGRVRYRATHDGPLVGVPATNRPVDFEAFHIVRVRDGRITEWWGTADLLGALRQIGAQITAPGDP